MKLKVTLITGLIVLGVAAAIYLRFYYNPYTLDIDTVSRTDAELSAMTVAIEAYKLDFGTYPEMRNSSLYRTLSGDNPRHKQYFVCPRNMVNRKKEIVDPWGNPYEFSVVEGFSRIRSAGRNGHFEVGGDDHSTETQ